MNQIPKELELYRRVGELMRVFNSAVRKAQASSRRLGVANVYSFNGQLYYELPNGDFTREAPSKAAEGESHT